ncbi:hypothetical protein GY45DRAFT_1317886 [Cubamyces sp. BRFM 1775]|nr:hypothetical protein GY45DRAFT_1317886 [Cubamyces sp. BRFM 1775]
MNLRVLTLSLSNAINPSLGEHHAVRARINTMMAVVHACLYRSSKIRAKAQVYARTASRYGDYCTHPFNTRP